MDIQLSILIARVIDEIGDPLLKHIRSRLQEHAPETIDAVVQTMVRCGVVRQKEDIYDHDWVYVLTPRGREVYADCLEDR